MTDRELLERYRKAPVKGVAVIEIAGQDGSTIDRVTQRLAELGMRNIRTTMRTQLQTADLSSIRQADVDRYLRKYGKTAQPETPQAGVVDESCDDCIFLDAFYGYKTCGFFSATRQRRGCPAGKGCTRREEKRKRRRGTGCRSTAAKSNDTPTNSPEQHRKKTNCPNCGAPIQREICEYCGTKLQM